MEPIYYVLLAIAAVAVLMVRYFYRKLDDQDLDLQQQILVRKAAAEQQDKCLERQPEAVMREWIILDKARHREQRIRAFQKGPCS